MLGGWRGRLGSLKNSNADWHKFQIQLPFLFFNMALDDEGTYVRDGRDTVVTWEPIIRVVSWLHLL